MPPVNRTLTTADIDSIVLGSLRNNKFSSAAVISHFTGIHEQKVTESFGRLLQRRLIHLAVGGVPKRYSVVEDNDNDDSNDNYSSYQNPIQEPEGTVIH